MSKFSAELIGTMILIILGDGVVANVLLNRSKGAKLGLDRHCGWLGSGRRCGCLRGWVRERRSFESGGYDGVGGDR